ncbi:MAG TPA: SPFH domain-containing protein [Leptospiraceae bacterium]|nr:SPFH domain-containing protein [Leptospiraceae bacterium]HMX34499.1 SPFH domain-containing protein [Leptospiraceae bacterium]HMY31128.1 SPFH domain-containing protein [Leptospiraceae bacterium]HMZ63711.1 SPFH domain-containing protein [Leptospiraceae bacterium]HNA09054.1 SPFH domain-containing protein [Leptospiraceae bacterium]
MANESTTQTGFELTSNSPDDPRMHKAWGYITALPSEYLIHFQGGKIKEKSSGQGATCFKWPRDTVFIIPTSLKEILFDASQLTSDNVDIRIHCMVVYRIVDPMRIYKLINFSNRQRGEEKLARMIADICRSQIKRFIAKLDLQSCYRKRKEEIADALGLELSNIVSHSETGWGLEVVTTEIQDIFIQDPEIFKSMQSLFKSSQLKSSRFAELETQKEIEVREIEKESLLAEYRLKQQLEQQKNDAKIKESALLLDKQNEEKKFELEKLRAEKEEEIRNYKLIQELELQRKEAEFELEKSKSQADAIRLTHEEELEYLQKKISVEANLSPQSLEKEFLEKSLPVLAEAFAKNLNGMNYQVIKSDGANLDSPLLFFIQQIKEIFQQKK